MKFGDGIDWNAEARRAAKEGMPGPKPGEMISRITAKQRWNEPECPRLVDCGCNIARFYPEAKTAGFVYVGVDQAPEALAIARSRYPEARFEQAMLWEPWSQCVGPVQAAICNAVLQHNTHADKKRILARIAQAVVPGGVFAMQESTVAVETATQLRQGDWVALVEGFGFELREMWHPNDEFKIFDGYLFTRKS
jgi:trans-aconitate methyltransferase